MSLTSQPVSPCTSSSNLRSQTSTSSAKLLDQCTLFLLKCAKTLQCFGPGGSRLSFKYDTCPNCSRAIAIVLLNKNAGSQKIIKEHLDSSSYIQLQKKLYFFLSGILDEYLFSGRSL